MRETDNRNLDEIVAFLEARCEVLAARVKELEREKQLRDLADQEAEMLAKWAL